MDGLRINEDLSLERIAVLILSGRLDLFTAADLKRRVASLVRGGYPSIVIDFANVSFIDSSGLAALVSGFKLIREAGGELKLASLQGQIRTIFSVTLLDRVFEFAKDIDTAIESLSGR